MSFKRKHVTPTLIQMEAAECGAACLSIILGYYGRFMPLEELRVQCGVSRDGCNAYNLLEAGKAQGLETEAYELNTDELHEMPLPAVLYWENNHFVVLEDYYPNDCAFINDPAIGPRKVPWKEFERKYSGIAFMMQPGESFELHGERESLFSLIKDRLKPFKKTILFLILAQVGVSIVGLIYPVFSRIFLDGFLTQKMWSWTQPFLWSILILAFFMLSFEWLRGQALRRLTTKLSLLTSSQFLLHALKLPIFFYFQRFGGEVMSRIRLNTQISQELVGKAAVTLLNIAFILFYGFVMIQYDVLITVFGIGAALFNLILLWGISESRKMAYAHLQQEQAKLTGKSIDFLLNMESIKTTGTQPFLFSRLMGMQTEQLNAWQSIGAKDVWLLSLTKLAQNITTMGLLLVGCWKVMFGGMTVGMLIAFQFLMNRFLAPFEDLVGFGSMLQTLKVDLLRVNDVMQNAQDEVFARRSLSSTQEKISPKLEFKDVTFGYAPLDEPLLRNLSFTVSEAHRVAVIGPTGAGKSTIANLAAGLFPPREGEVLYGDQLPTEYSRDQIANSLATVSQEIFLFEGSIYDNLTLWNKEVTEQEVVEALRDAAVYDEVMNLEGGIHAHLIEEGRNLSEGQRQRLEIARAFLHHPTLLILDEATSALDVETEAKVFIAMEKRKCACLFITHRLSVIKHCEEILVMDGGELIERGGHQDLMEKNGLYAKMINQQAFL